jgi:putative endonuclease
MADVQDPVTELAARRSDFVRNGWIPAFAGMTNKCGEWRSHISSFRRRPESSSMKHPCAYILASAWNGTIYVGVTSNLIKRVWEHKNDVVEGFTKKYRVHDLVWFEQLESMESAITREKAIKDWQRSWKIRLIEEANPTWRDLYPDLL